jgi:predicted RNA-binding protein
MRDIDGNDLLREAEVRRHITRLSKRDPELAELLWCSIGRIALTSVYPDRHALTVASFFNPFMRHAQSVDHVRDWLKSSILNDVPWLENVDAQGCPKKLMKCHSLDALVREADKDMLKQAKRLVSVKLVEGDEAVEFECAGGWKIVRLLTPAALDRESGVMQHCIGNGAYDDRVVDDQFRYLSLRDPAGKPHGTMELCGDSLLQFQGKQNVKPLEKYVRTALPFLRKRRIDCNRAYCGLVTDTAGEIYFEKQLPEELIVKARQLTLRSTLNNPIVLPKRMHMVGCLILIGTFENMPERLVVEGDLEIQALETDGGPAHTSFSRLPDDIWVTGKMTARELPLKALPSKMLVEGHLDLLGSKITTLPPELRCGGIDLSYTAVTEFDTAHFTASGKDGGLRWSRWLEARRSKLERIIGDPNFQKIDVSGSQLAALPDGLRVKGDLDITNTPVTRIPDDIIVGGSMRVDGCQITCLPTYLDVKSFQADRSVVSFPEKFRCPRSIYIRWGKIQQMPVELVAEDIIFIETDFEGLPSRVRGERLHFKGTKVRHIDGDVSVSTLDVMEDFEFLGADVRVSKQINVHCLDRKPGPTYCVAEITEETARKMITKSGRLDFRNFKKVPELTAPILRADDAKLFDRIFKLAMHFGEAA